jgi:phosphate butyryltransferase
MPLCGFDELFAQADARREPATVAVAGGADRSVVEALRSACDRRWVTPLVVGRDADIRRVADEASVSLRDFVIVDSDSEAVEAVALVRQGHAELLMKGQIATPALMQAILDSESGLRAGRVICQVVLMEIRPNGRRFLLADTGVCIQPVLEQKADILRSSVEVARCVEEFRPRVALMAATETVTESMPDTLDAAELQCRAGAGEFPDCLVQGPLSFDLAYAADAADKKRVGGPVVGAADVMIFPNLVSANLVVKAIMYTADCRFGGVLCGARCPIVFMSRADTAETRLRSLALALKLVSGMSKEND